MALLAVSGTGTEVGKTVTTAAVAALARAAGRRVAAVKPAQTGLAPGQDGDLAEVCRLAGPVTVRELARYPEPLAPDTAARRAGLPTVPLPAAADALRILEAEHDLVLCEGAGGLLARFDEQGWTLADLARELGIRVLVVAAPGLGTLNATALTTEALDRRGIRCAGVVIGSWPARPDLAMRCNLHDLPRMSGAPLAGVLPADMAALDRAAFLRAARTGLGPALGGEFDADAFTARHAP
ncbi:dethiobiotin synthase [Streptantibioticus cattleyicolor]|uniref:ATP-dependent dethiobiotin synthetase BioD n=1 Tax=Streptantibioticus cattleyicolor (strain ATCC 35852 / DSM 46488 / JCM 4925 / NBRC 14057 / NRRL 8057) TaxID=1003195 RepID=F8JJV5_STREN|nr:dethiobiotin synthase [Streptantibioticus cattleyicolor]AEW98619.1 dithiobiotin synthetase [Streptantibioticus cattleyicolor NRRL 8057 = DSM 46488]CCB72322.1 Dethiobiotin synthetase [Streptantibioticus cattleyicolor NRRL 8057 = DSM 46488]